VARNERESERAAAVARDEARRAKAAARAFLDGYLPYSYGRAGARDVRVATARLVRALTKAPARVPATVARAYGLDWSVIAGI